MQPDCAGTGRSYSPRQLYQPRTLYGAGQLTDWHGGKCNVRWSAAVADTHVVSALKERRIKLATEIEGLREQLRQRVIDLDHVQRETCKRCHVVVTTPSATAVAG